MKLHHAARAGLALACLYLAACGTGASSKADSPYGGSPPTVAVSQSRDGTIYRQEIPVAATGDTIVVQVFEPTHLEAGKTYPLVLQGHGYGGSRETEAPDGSFIRRLIDAGYYVVSIDERGFGESSGTVRVMSPDYEGQDLIAVLDWAENLPGLRRRSNGKMMVGSYGGSYGGMYQVLLYAADPQHRLRVLAPDITPHDLTYSLDPNNVVKSGWGLALVAGGEASVTQIVDPSNPTGTVSALLQQLQEGGTREDTAVIEILASAAATNNFTEAGTNFMKYHSLAYFCDGEPAGPQNFVLATPDPLNVAPDLPPAADVLLTQGFRDTLFNFNDGLHNYECLHALGGDVRLLTHQSGHILPVSLGTAGLEDPLDPFYEALTFPGFQDAGGTRTCGSLDLDDVQFAWFEDKLQGRGAVDDVLTTGKDFCLSLAEGDAIETKTVQRGGTSFAIDDSTPQLNSVLGVVSSLLGNGIRDSVLLADQPLYTVPAGGAIVAGVPMLHVDIEGLSGLEQDNCATTLVQLGCDPILFLAIGHRPVGQTRWDIIDDQITPVRGFGQHDLEMNGIAERLAEGEQVALLIYAFHAQYPVTWSRDLLVPALTLSGTVELPLLAPSAIVADGV
ncbi:CocE/NonD family hydrolase [Solimonas marina]|uniref:Peptidase S15 n=1 Tax=Solimonas marina TaxID=2714601 RepID=A0A969WAB3_9GAMM|nr:CocE/NonD family hydrolase [Solimonas marina]NKF22353.1 peptidase S15 [Solimonas marina]